MLPWDEHTIGSGLMLHAPLDLPTDIAAMRAEFAALDATLGAEHRLCFGGDGSWTSIPLIDRPPLHKPQDEAGTATPILDRLPSVRAFLARLDCTVLSCHISRQSPRGALRWHYDNQALHLAESRLILPIQAAAGAKTLIGHEAVAYPEGVVWTGDFTFPHMVDNATDEQRIVLLIDIACNDWIRGRAPAALSDEAARRAELACRAQNAWVGWPGRQTAYA